MRSWVIPAAIIIAIEYAAALLIGFRLGFHYSIPFSAYLISALVVAAVTVGCLSLLQILRGGDDRPLRYVLGRHAEVSIGIILVGLQWAAVVWLKVMLPIAQPFWADVPLATLDAAIFGAEPWRLTHSLLGWATPFIDQAYVTWAPIKFVVILALICAPRSQIRSRCLLAYFLFAAVGTLSQYLLSSAGPVFFGALDLGDRFADLPVPPIVEATRAYLWSDYLRGGGNIGGGISAFPSIHVAAALWIVLVVRSYFPRIQVFAWAWFALILVGSVHLGWHYALDGIAAVALTLAAWWLAGCWLQVHEGKRLIPRRPAFPERAGNFR